MNLENSNPAREGQAIDHPSQRRSGRDGDDDSNHGSSPSYVELMARLRVARAEDFLMAHLTEPVCLPDIAAATGLNARTLLRAFRQRHRMGPIGFQRQRRLEAVQRDLATADSDAASVTDVAMRYGFTHLGRFAGEYRKAFGELPSETLRGRAPSRGSAVS